MSGTGTRREALREIAREKARLKAEVASAPSIEESKAGGQQELEEPQEEGMVFKQASPEKIILEGRRDDDSSFGWTEFAPWRKERTEQKPKSLNTVTIWCMAQKMIAREWRAAKGIQKKDHRLDFLEQEAAAWGGKQEEERIRQEEARAGFEKQRVKVDEALKIIGRKILEEKGNLTSKAATTLVEDAMGAIGKVYDVEWRDDGCGVWIEPWEEKWSREKMGESLPVIYSISINDELEMVSYDLIEDEDLRLKVKEEMSANQLEGSLDEEPFGAEDEETEVLLEKKITEIGRLVELKKWKENAWIAIIEPWEEMRIRNIERKGEGPIETESILVKAVDGDVIVTALKPEDRGQKTEDRGPSFAEATEGKQTTEKSDFLGRRSLGEVG